MTANPETALAIAYAPARARPALEALFALDAAFAAVLASGSQPMIGRIRLAWWREALGRLDTAPPPAEPTLDAVAAHLLPLGLAGESLAAMEEGWAPLLDEGPLVGEAINAHGEARGAALFAFAARILGMGAPPMVAAAGRDWALADLARHLSRGDERAAVLAAIGAEPTASWPRPLRPLGMLAMLARRDRARGRGRIERRGAPARMARMLAHRLTGR